MSDVNNNVNHPKQISPSQKAVNIVAIVICILLIPILVMNCVMIVKGLINPDDVPSIFGKIPLIVETESMEPEIWTGDFILVDEVEDPTALEVGQVISFFDPENDSSTKTITHEIIEKIVHPKTGEILYRTKGVNNDIEDAPLVPTDKIVGVWGGFRIGGLGSLLLFAQSTFGILLLIIIPVAAFVVYEILKRRKKDQAKQSDIDQLRAELEAMKAAQAAATPAPATEPEAEATEPVAEEAAEPVVEETAEPVAEEAAEPVVEEASAEADTTSEEEEKTVE